MSDIYVLATDGFLPQLRLLRIYVQRSITKTISSGFSAMTSLCLPNLETFDLYLKDRREPEQGEEEVKWATVEILTSPTIMPRLRRYSLIYGLSTSAEIRDISQFLFDNYKRDIHIRFAFYIPIVESDASNLNHIRSTHPNDILALDVSISPF